MKKILLLTLTLMTCWSYIFAQQVVTVHVSVVTQNGQTLDSIPVSIWASTCDTLGYSDSATTTPNGVQFTFGGCSQGTIDVTVTCPDGTPVDGTAYYSPGSTNVSITLTCGGQVNTCNGSIGMSPGQSIYEYIFDANPSGVGPFNYDWNFGDGSTSQQQYNVYTYQSTGVFLVQLNTVDATGYQCTYFDTVYIQIPCIDYSQIDSTVTCPGINDPVCGCDGLTYDNSCEAENWYGVTSWTAGPCNIQNCDAAFSYSESNGYIIFSPLADTTGIVYSWDLGNGAISTDLNPVVSYPNGSYYVCLTVTTTNGVSCDYCLWVTVNNVPLDTCLDWSLIDFSAVCPGYDPVCGCDGITYDNECIAENCFGVAEWTPGPCNGGGSGNNGGGGTSTDSTCTTTAGFQYFGQQGPFGYDIYFFGSGTGEAPLSYYWDFGDGGTGGGINATHTFNDSIALDSIIAYTICLTVTDSVQCSSTVCETIILDSTPNGNVSGGVYEASAKPGGGGVSVGRNGSGNPIPNVTIKLLSPDGQVLATDITDASGLYSFDNLLFGDYYIKIEMPNVTHDGEHIKLTPIVQTIPDLEFEIDDDGQVSTAIEEIEFINEFSITPNPADDFVILNLEVASAVRATVSLTNLLGQTIEKQEVSLNKGTQSTRLNVDRLTPGIYLISIHSGKEIVTRKMIKN